MIFKDSAEFGWEEEKRDVRKHIFIKNRKWGAVNSIKSYACALKGDGKIDKTIRVIRRKEALYTSLTFLLSLIRVLAPRQTLRIL